MENYGIYHAEKADNPILTQCTNKPQEQEEIAHFTWLRPLQRMMPRMTYPIKENTRLGKILNSQPLPETQGIKLVLPGPPIPSGGINGLKIDENLPTLESISNSGS